MGSFYLYLFKVNMCPSLVEVCSVTSEIRHRKEKERKKEETTVVKYKLFGIAMPCGLISQLVLVVTLIVK